VPEPAAEGQTGAWLSAELGVAADGRCIRAWRVVSLYFGPARLEGSIEFTLSERVFQVAFWTMKAPGSQAFELSGVTVLACVRWGCYLTTS